MSETGQNFIVDSWQHGHINVKNIIPSDIGDVIGYYAQADLAQLNIALTIMDDSDLELAVAAVLGGAFGSTGQKCTSSSRLVVHKKIHDEFVDRLVASTLAMRVGHAL